MKFLDASDPAALGAGLLAERRTQKLSQAELAALAGVGVVTIYNLERGKPTIRLDALRAVADTLGLRLALIERTTELDERA